MTRDEIRTALKASPFRPFTIRMASGQGHEVPHPDFVFVPPEGRIIVVYSTTDRALAHVSLPLVESLDFHDDGAGEQRRKSG